MSTVRPTAHQLQTPGKALGRLFGKADFDPNAFCVNVLKNGRDEVDDVVRAAEYEMTQTEASLHEAVYQAEGLSVAATRQLRAAQADVCLLSSRLTEQRSEIGKLMAAPLFSSEASGNQTGDMRRNSDSDNLPGGYGGGGGGGLLAEKVEGCGFLGDAPGRGLLFDGQLTELDPHPPNSPIRRIHMYLLTDCIVTAVVPPHHPRSVMRNRFDRLFPLDHVAVTAAPLPAPSTRLRLLSFPESRLFDTDNTGVRTAWLHQIDIAKRSRSRNRGQQDSSIHSEHDESGPKNESTSSRTADWVQESLDELDVFVAERDFNAAVSSLLTIRREAKVSFSMASAENQQVTQQIDGTASTATERAISNRLRQRYNELVFLLFRELDTSANRAAYLDARQAVTLLARIGKAIEATHRFLGFGTTILKNKVHHQTTTTEGSTSMTSMSRQIAENMANTGFEIIANYVEVVRGALANCGFDVEKSESDKNSVDDTVLTSCIAALTGWVSQQTLWLTTQVYEQIEQQSSNLPNLADCADTLRRAIRNQAVFAGVGLEVWPICELFIAPHTTAAVKQAQAVLVESIKKHLVVHSSSGTVSRENPIKQIPPDLIMKIGKEPLVKHFKNCPIAPPSRVCQFAEAILNFSTQLCSLYSTMQHTALCRSVTLVFRVAADQLAKCMQPDKPNEEILASFRFLFGPVLERIMLHFRKISKLETKEFIQLQKDCYGGNPPPLPPHQLTPPLTRSSSKEKKIRSSNIQQVQKHKHSGRSREELPPRSKSNERDAESFI